MKFKVNQNLNILFKPLHKHSTSSYIQPNSITTGVFHHLIKGKMFYVPSLNCNLYLCPWV